MAVNFFTYAAKVAVLVLQALDGWRQLYLHDGLDSSTLKARALKSPRTGFLQSPMAITGSILAMGVIRLQDQMALDKSAIQASDRNIDPRSRTNLINNIAKATEPDCSTPAIGDLLVCAPTAMVLSR
jgi:hypothetical protein